MFGIETKENILDRVEAEITDIKKIADETVEVSFWVADPRFSFAAGQYAWITLPKLRYPDTRGNSRAFSFASAPNQEGTFSIIFLLSRSGFKRTLALMKKGDKVFVAAPFGYSTLEKLNKKPFVFIAGGRSIPPALSVIRFLAKGAGFKNKVTLVSANVSQARAVYKEELEKTQKENANFNFISIIGPLKTDFLGELLEKNKNALWHITGPKEMVEFIAEDLLSRGVKEKEMSFGEYYGIPAKAKIDLEARVDRGVNLYKRAVEDSSDHIVVTDKNGVVIYANKSAERMTGYSFAEMQGQTPRLWGGLLTDEFYEKFWDTVKNQKKPFEGKVVNRRKDQGYYVAIAKVAPILAGKELIGFVATETDITEITRLDEAKTEFVSLASHQLKSPLTAINWYVEMLLSGDAGKLSSKQKQFIDEIYQGNKRMVDLVNSLLNVSRIDLNAFAVQPEQVKAKEVAESVLKELAPQAKAKQTQLATKYAQGLPAIKADPRLLRMIFQNLLSNAIKYTPNKGKVSLTVAKKGKDLYLEVADNGYGIPRSQQAKIFSRFFRAKNIQQKEVEGNGLGLYIIKAIVEQNGGKIWFASEENKGTTFFVALPLAGMQERKGTSLS